jgi:hypothetical protein
MPTRTKAAKTALRMMIRVMGASLFEGARMRVGLGTKRDVASPYESSKRDGARNPKLGPLANRVGRRLRVQALIS